MRTFHDLSMKEKLEWYLEGCRVRRFLKLFAVSFCLSFLFVLFVGWMFSVYDNWCQKPLNDFLAVQENNNNPFFKEMMEDNRWVSDAIHDLFVLIVVIAFFLEIIMIFYEVYVSHYDDLFLLDKVEDSFSLSFSFSKMKKFLKYFLKCGIAVGFVSGVLFCIFLCCYKFGSEHDFSAGEVFVELPGSSEHSSQESQEFIQYVEAVGSDKLEEELNGYLQAYSEALRRGVFFFFVSISLLLAVMLAAGCCFVPGDG